MRYHLARGAHELERNKSRFVMMSMGILLFVIGFLLTVSAIPGADSAERGSTTSQSGMHSTTSQSASRIYLVSGIVVSFAGVLLATIGPAASFLRTKEGK